MATNATLLCIHRDPAQLRLLRENGYELLIATNGHDGLRLFMSNSVDAIVMEYHLGLLDGAVVATEIKQVRPQLPIIMLTEDLELPDGALNSVDAVVTKADGFRFLLAAIQSVLNVRTQPPAVKARAQTPAHLRRTGRSREWADRAPGPALRPAADPKELPLSPTEWDGIRSGAIHF